MGEVGATGTVVTDRDAQDGVCGVGFDGDRDGRGAGVLGRVGQRLGDDVVRADLDLAGQPPVGAQVEMDRDRRAASERIEGGGQTPSTNIAGWMPSAISRSSSIAPVATVTARSSCAPSSGGAAACAVRSCSTSETNRCWAPSCRSRSMRRRVWSAVATIRARERL